MGGGRIGRRGVVIRLWPENFAMKDDDGKCATGKRYMQKSIQTRYLFREFFLANCSLVDFMFQVSCNEKESLKRLEPTTLGLV